MRVKRWGMALGLLWWLTVAGLFGLRWVQGGTLVAALQSGLPVVGASLVLLLFLAAMGRAKTLVALTVLLLTPMVWLAWPWWFDSDVAPATDSDQVVMTSNMFFGSADVAALEREVSSLEVDALVLLEVTPSALAQIESSGIPSALPFRSGQPHPDASGTVVFTAEPHQELGDVPELFFDQVAVEIEPASSAGQAWVLFGAHPAPPTLPEWAGDLQALSDWVDRQPASTPLVMAGDFNASSAHPAFRDLESRLNDAQRLSGSGWVRTWPHESLIPPFAHLDHVMIRGFGVVATGQAIIAGTDHSAVWARLSR